MGKGRSNQLTKQVGEYLVACELARRGFLVATFSGNVPVFDLIATDLQGSSIPIQVKTIRGGSWQFTIDKFVDIAFDGNKQIFGDKKPLPMRELICVFVIAAERYRADKFFVLEMERVQEILVGNHRRWLEAHCGVRPKKFDSMHSAIVERDLLEFKDNWQLITNRRGG